MTAPARRIEQFVTPAATTPATVSDLHEKPVFVGHLLEMPLTNGEEAMVDPEEVISVSAHRADVNVTVVRQHNDNFTYFVNRPYVVVKRWIADALKR